MIVVQVSQIIQTQVADLQVGKVEVLFGQIQLLQNVSLQEQLLIFRDRRQVLGGHLLRLENVGANGRPLGSP